MASKAAGRSATGRLVWLKRLALAAASSALTLLTVEGLLAMRALPLSEAASRYVYGCYESSQPGRHIHAAIKPLKVRLHRPDFEADCYFLGYRWRHRSDGFGWRNPATWDSADVVVLGDSIIYGHGVEEEQTTTHFLRGLLKRMVVNMGITGGSPVQYMAHLRNFALPLRPKVIVVFFFGNDLTDVRKIRSSEDLARFVSTGKGREARVLPRATLLEKLRLLGKRPASALDRLALYRLVDYHLRAWRLRRAGPVIDRRERASRPPPDPTAMAPPSDEILDRMEGRLPVAYVRRALAVMAESSRDANAILVLGHIGRRTNEDWLLRRLLREASGEHGFHYFDTPVLEGRHRLPNDGHLSEDGHRRLAETLAAYLDELAIL